MYTGEEKIKAISDGTHIFNQVYKKNISEETFAHKHFENPFCVETPFLINYLGDAPVAMRWMMGMDMLYRGQHFKAVQSSDDAALPEAKGLAFVKIRKSSERIMKSEGVDFVYGCFYPGNAMDIAEKLGEKNIVNLYAAKLPLSDTVYTWKRFHIPILNYFVKARASKLVKKLQKAAKLCDSEINISQNCPFDEADFEIINDGRVLRVSRSKAYYEWKFSLLDSKSIKYVTARKNGILTGFIIVKAEETEDIIVDWEIFGTDAQKSSLLAAMIIGVCRGKNITVPSLNPTNGEMSVFTHVGFADMHLQKAPVCICAKAFNDAVADIINNQENWKHRDIDADYFLN